MENYFAHCQNAPALMDAVKKMRLSESKDNQPNRFRTELDYNARAKELINAR